MKHFNIELLNTQYQSTVQSVIDNKTKPVGALGQLESLALQLGIIQGVNPERPHLQINKPTMLVFAADHGIAREGVSIAPSEVTAQMVANFLNGGAAINCFCRMQDIRLQVIDAGILQPINEAHPILVSQRIGAGTENFSVKAAMSKEQAERAIDWGAVIAQRHIQQGSNLLLLGEMGIGNTSSASAILAALTNQKAKQTVGAGTGINQTQLNKKIKLIDKALLRFKKRDPLSVLAQVGGFEIAQMTGAILFAAESKVPTVIDGFIAGAAALVAIKLEPNAKDYLIFAHQSAEQAHQLMLDQFAVQPLLDLGLRLGEGTGAALSLSLIQAAVAFYNEMASFESAGVTV